MKTIASDAFTEVFELLGDSALKDEETLEELCPMAFLGFFALRLTIKRFEALREQGTLTSSTSVIYIVIIRGDAERGKGHH